MTRYAAKTDANHLEENEWDRWKREQEAKQRQAMKEERQKEERLSAVKRPVTEHERAMILALAPCTFLPGSWDKRFVRSLAIWQPYGNNLHYETVDEISDKQAYWLNKLAHKYRRQIGKDLSEAT